MTVLCVGQGTRVTLNFGLYLDDGSVVDSNFDQQPVSFQVGDGSMLPGFERALFGMESGQSGEFSIAPEDGFGQPNENNIQVIPRDRFDGGDELTLGMMFTFADAAGGELPGVLVYFDEEEVHVDFNHPLAGRVITFRVEIHDVQVAELH